MMGYLGAVILLAVALVWPLIYFMEHSEEMISNDCGDCRYCHARGLKKVSPMMLTSSFKVQLPRYRCEQCQKVYF